MKWITEIFNSFYFRPEKKILQKTRSTCNQTHTHREREREGDRERETEREGDRERETEREGVNIRVFEFHGGENV
jgi:hypothetical protein